MEDSCNNIDKNNTTTTLFKNGILKTKVMQIELVLKCFSHMLKCTLECKGRYVCCWWDGKSQSVDIPQGQLEQK